MKNITKKKCAVFAIAFALFFLLCITVLMRKKFPRKYWGNDPRYLSYTFGDLQPFDKVYYHPYPKRDFFPAPNDSDFHGVIVLPSEKIKEIFAEYHDTWISVEIQDRLIPDELILQRNVQVHLQR